MFERVKEKTSSGISLILLLLLRCDTVGANEPETWRGGMY